MIYTVEEHGADGIKTQTYEGFRRYVKDEENVAVVNGPDGVELWVVENDGLAIEELKRYYRATYNYDADVVLYQKI